MACKTCPGTPLPSSPPLAAQIGSAAAALVQFALGNRRELPQVDQDARMAACNGCWAQEPKGVCNRCGCLLDVKVRMAGQFCPLGKWPV